MSKRWISSVDRAQREILPLPLALYHAAREYPGGIKAVAAVYGLNPTTLQHKLSPTESRHKISLDDLEAVLSATQDARILDSLGEMAGGALWVRAVGPASPAAVGGSDQHATLAAIAELHERLGHMIRSVRSSLGEGIVDDRERAELRLRTRRLLEAVLILEQAALYDGDDEEDLV